MIRLIDIRLKVIFPASQIVYYAIIKKGEVDLSDSFLGIEVR